MRKAPMKVLNLPFEATFRLQVRICRSCVAHILMLQVTQGCNEFVSWWANEISIYGYAASSATAAKKYYTVCYLTWKIST